MRLSAALGLLRQRCCISASRPAGMRLGAAVAHLPPRQLVLPPDRKSGGPLTHGSGFGRVSWARRSFAGPSRPFLFQELGHDAR